MVAGPPINMPGFPDGVRFYDLLWVGAASLGLLVIARSGTFPHVRGTPLLFAFLGYVCLVLVLPLIGLILLPQAQLAWYLGDLRWIQILSIAALFVLVYRKRGYARFQVDLTNFLLALVVLNALVLGAQVWLQIAGGSTPFVLDLWYPEHGRGYGRYGFHINRYAGAMAYASGLALIGGVSLLVSLFSKRGGWRSYLVGFAGLLFVIASGNRSVIFGLPVLLFLVLMVRLAITRRMQKLRFAAVAGGLLAVSAAVWAVLNLNLGRMFGGDNRITQTIGILFGETTFQEVSGRGGARWVPLIRESQDWTFLGTLVNPSHAFDHLPNFDNMFVFMFAQAGPLLLGGFIIFSVSLAYYAWRVWLSDRAAGAFPMAVLVTVMVVSTSQNLITGMTGRVLLTLAVVQIVMYLTYRHGSPKLRPGAGPTVERKGVLP